MIIGSATIKKEEVGTAKDNATRTRGEDRGRRGWSLDTGVVVVASTIVAWMVKWSTGDARLGASHTHACEDERVGKRTYARRTHPEESTHRRGAPAEEEKAGGGSNDTLPLWRSRVVSSFLTRRALGGFKPGPNYSFALLFLAHSLSGHHGMMFDTDERRRMREDVGRKSLYNYYSAKTPGFQGTAARH